MPDLGNTLSYTPPDLTVRAVASVTVQDDGGGRKNAKEYLLWP